MFSGKQGYRFAVFKPALGYFAHTYNLEQILIEIEGKSPKPSQLKQLIGYLRDMGIKLIFVQPQFSAKSAKIMNRKQTIKSSLRSRWMRIGWEF